MAISKLKKINVIPIRQTIKNNKVVLRTCHSVSPFYQQLETINTAGERLNRQRIQDKTNELENNQVVAFCTNIEVDFSTYNNPNDLIKFEFDYAVYTKYNGVRYYIDHDTIYELNSLFQNSSRPINFEELEIRKRVARTYIAEIKSLENVLRLACAKVTGISEINDKQIFAFETESDLSSNMCYGSVYRL